MRTSRKRILPSAKLREVLSLAKTLGLFRGARTTIVSGLLPSALLDQARARTGIRSDTDLIKLALANLAVADDYPEWLLSPQASVNRDLDIEF